ncbi:MAG TPA: hypothetical protein VJ843_03585 [Candidatus Saccharimonadales bacterium]|nr:hypothetical protein [Candidatus Saccharimonadales bacterium]
MQHLAVAAFAAGNTGNLVSAQMLVGEFVGIFIIATIYTIVKAKRKNTRNPVAFGITMGAVTGILAVLLTVFLGTYFRL